jgi:hypothetical protein
MDDMTTIGQLLREIFNHDFSACADSAAFHAAFFKKALTIHDLKKVFDVVAQSTTTIGGKIIPAAFAIPAKEQGAPFLILAQMHGNEPPGLAGILLAMALSEAGMLKKPVIGAIGNPLAAAQYFDAYLKDPHSRQETRDAYRCGLAEDGRLLPDMNRIPVDFMTRDASDHHTRRAQELYILAQHIWGIADIHSARGNMVCITDHKHDRDLKFCPIRNVLTELAEAISAHASTSVQVKTFKTISSPLPNIKSQTGIEAGRHEAPDAPYNAAAFTLALLHTLEVTPVAPLKAEEDGKFIRYGVRPRITYADLVHHGVLHGDDKLYMAKSCEALASVPERSDTVIVRQPNGHFALQKVAEYSTKPAGEMRYAVYQYDEMEAISKGDVVAVAIPSGVAFHAPESFSGIFVSKSAALYDKDPAVGPWPVAADKIASVKFCYPCHVSGMKLAFD